MILNEYNEIIRENFDISDSGTRKFIISLDEAEQNQVLSTLASALYDKIVQKADQIDFGTIPKSRGDITKVDGFENTMECLNIMRRLVLEYHEDPKIVDHVLGAIENVRTRRGLFVKGFSLNVELPMVLYNLITMAIEQSVSFLIAVCIQYIKDPETEDIKTALDKVAYKNAKDNLLYQQLELFNTSCGTKELDKMLDTVIKRGGRVSESVENEIEDTGGGVNTIIINVGKDAGAKLKPGKCGSPFKKYDDEEDEKKDGEEDCPEKEVPIHGRYDDSYDAEPNQEPIEEVVGIGIALSAFLASLSKAGLIAVAVPAIAGGVFALKEIRFLFKVIIPFMRNIVYYCIHSVTKVSDYFAIQAQFIEANAYKLKYSTNSNLSDEKKEKVVKKQLKWAERFRALANKIAISDKKARVETDKDIKEDENNKVKVENPEGSNGGNSGGVFSYA